MLFHITAVELVDKILSEGLKGTITPRNRGETLDRAAIYSLIEDNDDLFDEVAITQIWPLTDIERYAIITIDDGNLAGSLVEDCIQERTAPWHQVIIQDVIPPLHLKHHRTRELNYPGSIIQQVLTKQLRKKWSPEEWRAAELWVDPQICIRQRRFESGDF